MNLIPHHKARLLGVTWQRVDIAAQVFARLQERALQATEGGVLPPSNTADGAADPAAEAFIARCNYDFIMSFKSPPGSNLAPKEKREGQMKDHGVMPLGTGVNEGLGEEVVYVLARGDTPTMPASPFLRTDAINFLYQLLVEHHCNGHIVLLGVRSDVFDRAINYLYYRVEIPPPVGGAAPGSGGPVPVDEQVGDPPEIAKARFWLLDAIQRTASDIHLEPVDGGGRLRLRIDGKLTQIPDAIPESMLVQVITWVKTQAGMDSAEKRVPLGGSLRLSYRQADTVRLVDVRVSTIPTIYGQKMVMRLLDPENLRRLAAGSLKTMIGDDRLHGSFVNALDSRDGIVLVTGPTGSGKTTTLNSGLYHLLRKCGDTQNIVTIEDPVEYNVPGVNQIEVNERAGLTFALALRTILRQDPDIVLVGEIRDQETATVAIQAALTGHLILSTLHTNDALGSVDRLQDLGISPFLIASTVRLFQAQRLVRRLCGNCGRQKPLLGRDLERKVAGSRLAAHRERLLDPGVTVFEPARCAQCEWTGFRDRAAVMEMAEASTALTSAIEAKSSVQVLRRVAREHSAYRPMLEVGLELLCRGGTAMSELEAICLATGQESAGPRAPAVEE